MRDRRGWGILVVLIAMLIVGYLFVKQARTMLPAKGGAKRPEATLPDQARIETFKLTAMMVRNTIAMHQASTGKTVATWNELANLGFNTSQEDPWGGKYYIQNGKLRCTGNPKVSEGL